ncbi:glycosyltransferase [Aeromonas veronii]|uniref:glycosyltransferase n=1 Tax=Aeromonas veronii TaxID=654 RepID=UPI00366BBC4C
MKVNKKSKNIAFVVATPMTANCFLIGIFNELIKRGYNVFLFTNTGNSSCTHKGVTVVNLKIVRNVSILSDLSCLLSLSKKLKEFEIDIVHSITPKAGLLSTLSGLLAGVRYRIHSFTGQVWVDYKGIRKLFYKSIDKLIFKLNTVCFADGFSQKNFLIKSGIVDDNLIVLNKGSLSGVDLTRFFPDQNCREFTRREYGISNDDFVYLFLGRINEDKGIYDLLTAFDELSSIKKSRLMIVGPDETGIFSDFKNPDVVYAGSTNQPEKFYNMADVLCLPSYREGFGTSVLESCACGTPAIVSDIYGLEDVVVDNYNGLVHKVRNPKDLMMKMLLLSSNPNLRLALSKNAIDFAKQNFSSEDLSNALADFYESNLR